MALHKKQPVSGKSVKFCCELAFVGLVAEFFVNSISPDMMAETHVSKIHGSVIVKIMFISKLKVISELDLIYVHAGYMQTIGTFVYFNNCRNLYSFLLNHFLVRKLKNALHSLSATSVLWSVTD